MKYVMLFVEPEQYAKELEAMSPEERAEAYAAVGRWFEEHSDRVGGCHKPSCRTPTPPRPCASTVAATPS